MMLRNSGEWVCEYKAEKCIRNKQVGVERVIEWQFNSWVWLRFATPIHNVLFLGRLCACHPPHVAICKPLFPIFFFMVSSDCLSIVSPWDLIVLSNVQPSTDFSQRFCCSLLPIGWTVALSWYITAKHTFQRHHSALPPSPPRPPHWRPA